MLLKRLLAVFISLHFFLNAFTTHAWARSRTRYNEYEVRLSYPDQVFQSEYEKLRTHANQFIDQLTPSQKTTFISSLKNTPYHLNIYKEVSSENLLSTGKEVLGRVLFVEHEGSLIRHYMLSSNDRLVISVNKQLLKDADMDFLERHLKEVYSKSTIAREVSITWNGFIHSQDVYTKSHSLAAEDVDLMAKATVMSLSYNKRVHEMNESTFDAFINGSIEAEIERVNGPNRSISPETLGLILPLYNLAIEKLEDFYLTEAYEYVKGRSAPNQMGLEQTAELMHEAREAAQESFLKGLQETGNIEFHDIELGKVVLTTIDGELVYKIRPNGTEKIFLWAPKGLISADSTHLRQYISRQFIDAGTDRSDGERGRDVVLMWADELGQGPDIKTEKTTKSIPKVTNSSVQFNYHQRPQAWTAEYFKHYWRATYKPTSASDKKLGIYCAVLQGLVMAGVNVMKVSLGYAEAINPWTIGVIMVFGGVIGANSSTYVNWKYRKGKKTDSEFKNKAIQTAKGATISVMYSVSVGIVDNSLHSLYHIAYKAYDIVMNSYGKTEFEQWAVIKREKRADLKSVGLPYIGLKKQKFVKLMNFDTGKKILVNTSEAEELVKSEQAEFLEADSERRVRNRYSIGLKWIDVPEGKVNFQIKTQNAIIAVRSVSLMMQVWWVWASIPLVKYLTLKWAEKNHPDMAEKLELRQKWDNFIFNPNPKRLVSNLYRVTILKAMNTYKEKQIQSDFVRSVNSWSNKEGPQKMTPAHRPEQKPKRKPDSILKENLSCQGLFAAA